MNSINKTKHKFDVLQIVEIITFSLLMACLFGYFVYSENVNNGNNIYSIVFYIHLLSVVLVLIYPIIIIIKIIFLIAKKLYSIKRIFTFVFTVFLYFTLIFSILLVFITHDSDNRPEDVNLEKVETYIRIGGFSSSEIRNVAIYEYKKNSDFHDKTKAISLLIISHGKEYVDVYSEDSLCVLNDWLLIVNDSSIIYKITEQEVEPVPQATTFSVNWVNSIKAYKINGIDKTSNMIVIKKSEGIAMKTDTILN